MPTEVSTHSDADALLRRIDELEQELERAQRLATLGTMVGSIAHEFNNILTPVMSLAQLASSHPTDAELTRKALGAAVKNSERAAEIASSILGFIRSDTPEAVCHVQHALKDALHCLVRDPLKDGIHLSTDIDPRAWVRMRPVSLQQVLLNLMLNAKNAMGSQGGRLSVTAERSTGNTSEREVTIRVRDTGPGIPADMANQIFEPFVRGRKPKQGGSGLGLAICRRLVHQAGGSIVVDLEYRDGCGIEIRVPGTDPIIAKARASAA